MPQSKVLYPYAYSSQIRLIARDPHDPSDEAREFRWRRVEEESDDAVSTLDLSHEERAWDRVRFQIEASLAAESIAELVPPSANPDTDLRMLVSVTCTPTRLREAVELVRDGSGWRGDVALRRSQVRGTVQLMPFLVRTTDLPDGAIGSNSEPLATEHALRVAEGRPIDLVVDPPKRNLAGFVRTVWENFADSADPIRRQNSSLAFHLELGGEEPTLVLNSALTGMRAALHSRKRIGGAAVMRNTLNAAIAQNVWMQLFMAAVASLDYSEETGEVSMPSQHWKRRSLEALVDRMPSDVPPAERPARLARLRDSHMETLVATLSIAAQRAVGIGRLIKDAERAAERYMEGPDA